MEIYSKYCKQILTNFEKNNIEMLSKHSQRAKNIFKASAEHFPDIYLLICYKSVFIGGEINMFSEGFILIVGKCFRMLCHNALEIF